MYGTHLVKYYGQTMAALYYDCIIQDKERY